ncbi:tail fiber assembly protein [Escherichia coli]|uniref:tail fiber assembly protein n=1 Tax=Escherichia coli TaxID=562 RepID=UPI0023F68C7B|nr:tail fiber assembly protein [Escherichia coli]MDF6494774.1 tail fiber assembly protein [Escherichia coli]MEB7881925.1 tail fiber assembly protein [Escherichia coli]HAY8349325.1 tail fiber assembly protein [Shigella flexneri]HEA3189257.1 tail fiber assembly protein [Escherichia coli]
MKMKWSPSVQGFFSENNSDIPDDAFDIEDALYYELMNGQSTGKIIINNPDNYPVLTEYPAKTQEQEIAEAEGMKSILIEQANEYMNSKQWPGKAAIGRLNGEELAQYNLWLDYLDALELVDTSSAPDIEWPTPPAVQAR